MFHQEQRAYSFYKELQNLCIWNHNRAILEAAFKMYLCGQSVMQDTARFVLSSSPVSADETHVPSISNVVRRAPFMTALEGGAQDHLGSNLDSVTDFSCWVRKVR